MLGFKELENKRMTYLMDQQKKQMDMNQANHEQEMKYFEQVVLDNKNRNLKAMKSIKDKQSDSITEYAQAYEARLESINQNNEAQMSRIKMQLDQLQSVCQLQLETIVEGGKNTLILEAQLVEVQYCYNNFISPSKQSRSMGM